MGVSVDHRAPAPLPQDGATPSMGRTVGACPPHTSHQERPFLIRPLPMSPGQPARPQTQAFSPCPGLYSSPAPQAPGPMDSDVQRPPPPLPICT